MFNDVSGLSYKSLYGLCEAPKTQYEFLEQNLEKVGFKTSWSNPGIYYGRGTALAPYVDNIFLVLITKKFIHNFLAPDLPKTDILF